MTPLLFGSFFGVDAGFTSRRLGFPSPSSLGRNPRKKQATRSLSRNERRKWQDQRVRSHLASLIGYGEKKAGTCGLIGGMTLLHLTERSYAKVVDEPSLMSMLTPRGSQEQEGSEQECRYKYNCSVGSRLPCPSASPQSTHADSTLATERPTLQNVKGSPLASTGSYPNSRRGSQCSHSWLLSRQRHPYHADLPRTFFPTSTADASLFSVKGAYPFKVRRGFAYPRAERKIVSSGFGRTRRTGGLPARWRLEQDQACLYKHCGSLFKLRHAQAFRCQHSVSQC